MIAYTGNASEDLDLSGDKWLVDSFLSNAALYAPGLPTEARYTNVGGSDHYYFHSSRFPGSSSLLAIEDTPTEIWGGSNPYYHKTTDTADRLDWGFAFQVTKVAGATLATIAGGTRPVPAPPVVLLLLLGLPLLRLRRL